MTAYTSDELNAIASAPMTVGMAVAIADMGIISSAIEAVALTKEIVGAGKKYPNNSIVQAVFSEAVLASGKIQRKKPDFRPEDIESGAFVTKAIAAVDLALAAIGDKATPTEITEFKQFVYDCAEAVASAAGSGLFGSGDPKISPAEASALAKIKAGLSI
ncbi:hypothetical protein [Chamaesiphon minutus]|uniref:Uncharacterized protein n=1 Tax=Chamaesiphon minutus (strain ATCC 27169 / PCC 6605) TaxID=1173020 RepID=K9UAK1_CHAP6|nr:hypothetical protein [Chamaesiphon minutus]AFY91451.1 hypothetical protein Cha6605_0145 [Chamaesiphon minutus PCC 6605]